MRDERTDVASLGIGKFGRGVDLGEKTLSGVLSRIRCLGDIWVRVSIRWLMMWDWSSGERLMMVL